VAGIHGRVEESHRSHLTSLLHSTDHYIAEHEELLWSGAQQRSHSMLMLVVLLGITKYTFRG
jgi:hypothetical protein